MKNIRSVFKSTCLGLVFLLGTSALAHADVFLLKTGQIIRGKLLEKKSDSYVVELDDTKEKTEFAVSSVSIADISPTSDAMPKGAVSFPASLENPYDESERPLEPSSQRVVVVPEGATQGQGSKKHFNDVLQNASDTVALSNSRTEQMQKLTGELKDIADKANQS